MRPENGAEIDAGSRSDREAHLIVRLKSSQVPCCAGNPGNRVREVVRGHLSLLKTSSARIGPSDFSVRDRLIPKSASAMNSMAR